MTPRKAVAPVPLRGGQLAAGLVAIAGLLLTGFAPATADTAKPRRVMSMNACTDQLVLLLLPSERISSVTYLAADAAVTPEVAAKIRKTRTNDGLSEQMLAEKPDLVLTEAYSAPPARKLAREAGVPMMVVDDAETFDDIRRITRQVAAAVGETERGEALLRRMDDTLAELKRTAPKHRLLALGWDGSGRAPGRHSLFNTILTAAGGVNLGAGEGGGAKSVDLEQLLALRPRPDLLLYGSSGVARPGLQTAAVQHPALARAFAGRRLAVPDYQCGTPEAANQARALRREMLRAMGQAESGQ